MGTKFIVAGVTLAAALCTAAITYSQTDGKSHVMLTPSALSWGAAPPTLPPGAQASVLEGDPSKPGPFTIRIKAPDGYRIAPHYHPADEHVTVLQGALLMGLGDKADMAAARELTMGSFAVMPAGVRHFASMKGETILQLHGVGPWGITYVNPADDPRQKPSQ
jgi:quercetin dioxygenase-like cupin family protein